MDSPSDNKRPEAPSEEACFLDSEPSTSFKNSTVQPSSSKSSTPLSAVRKMSFRKLSVESGNLPLNDDCSELNEEKEKSIATLEKTMIKRRRSGSSDKDNSMLKSMSEDQLEEHVSQCVKLSTENKINIKNAFALKLIDCMTIMQKKEDKSRSFTAMACQLDATAKIYSSRVDAVHQQVMKLAETCIYAEKKNEQEENEEEDQTMEGVETDNKERRKKPKKKVISSNDQVNRLPKEDDPRDKFFKMEALPGEIFKRAVNDPRDLSLSLEKTVPFWVNALDKKPLVLEEEEDIPDVETIDRSQRLKLDLQSTIDRSCLPKITQQSSHSKSRMSTLSKSLRSLKITEGEDEDADMGVDAHEDPLSSDESSEVDKKDDIEIVSLAKMKITSEGSNIPSSADVIKTLFHTPGESDYHYLKKDSQRFWAGPVYWKRPHGQNFAEEKRKTIRKKKEPAEVHYTTGETENEPTTHLPRKASTLSKRTTDRWTTKKTTLPIDIHFDMESFQTLFGMDIIAEVMHEDSNKESEEDNDSIDHAQDNASHAGSFQGLSPTHEQSSSPFNPEQGFLGFPSSEEGSTSSFNPEQGFRGFPSPSQPSQPSQAISASPEVAEYGRGYTGFSQELLTQTTDDNPDQVVAEGGEGFDGENLVPMVRRVKVDPIKYKARPSRVDMQHLKQIMLNIIRRAIEDRENQLKGEGMQEPQGSVYFRDVLTKLYTTRKLNTRTRDDLTFQMAFLSLLTLANENDLCLKKDESEDILITYASDV